MSLQLFSGPALYNSILSVLFLIWFFVTLVLVYIVLFFAFWVLMQLKTKEECETFWERIEGPANDEQ
jgi:hypothetical protein